MRRAFVACLVCVAALLFAAPAYAATGDYSIDELSTEMTVNTDASVHVVERQTVTFQGDSNGVVWYLHVPEGGESVRISSVRATPVDKGGTALADPIRLQMIDSDPVRQGRQPGDPAALSLRINTVQPWYSYNIGDGMMRCYFPLAGPTNEEGAGESSSATKAEPYLTYVIETDYVIRHRVFVYRDVAELYWRYVNDSLPSDSYDVNFQVKLPVPGGFEEGASETIKAWGHGPNDGTFSVSDDGTVTYHLDHIARGVYAEAHIIFPAVWMVDTPSDAMNVFSSIRGAEAIEEESEWVDVSQRQAAWDNNVRVFFLIVAMAVILVGIVSVLFRGRTARSRRVLLRVSAVLAIIALAENLFFREPLTTLMLVALAVIVAAIMLMLPVKDEDAKESAVLEAAGNGEGSVEREDAAGVDRTSAESSGSDDESAIKLRDDDSADAESLEGEHNPSDESDAEEPREEEGE